MFRRRAGGFYLNKRSAIHYWWRHCGWYVWVLDNVKHIFQGRFLLLSRNCCKWHFMNGYLWGVSFSQTNCLSGGRSRLLLECIVNVWCKIQIIALARIFFSLFASLKLINDPILDNAFYFFLKVKTLRFDSPEFQTKCLHVQENCTQCGSLF